MSLADSASTYSSPNLKLDGAVLVSRKLSCGSRTAAGKTTWEVFRSIAVTTHRHGNRPLDPLASRLQLAARFASADG